MAPIYAQFVDFCRPYCLCLQDYFIIVLLPVAFACLLISYLFFGAYFLKKDIEVCEKFNYFWLYCLFSLFTTPFGYLLSQNVFNNLRSEKDKVIGYEAVNQNIFGLFAMFTMPFLIWGCITLYFPGPCDNMKHAGLYVFAYVTFWWQLLYSTVVIAGAGIAICDPFQQHPGTLTRMNVANSISNLA
jgi:hypothetical protein